VKVGEIGAWLGRRDKSPRALMGACSRFFWRWQHKYMQPKRVGIAPFFQVVVGSMIVFYAMNYGKISEFRERGLAIKQQPDDFPFLSTHRAPQKLQVSLSHCDISQNSACRSSNIEKVQKFFA
jgi:Mitochondrial F1F0-ATP synthase, subunit f